MEPVSNNHKKVLVERKSRYILTSENRIKITETIRNNSQPDVYYYVMVILSCAVATYGLLSNSTAVIIGAMLIAPLMNPILGGALALITGNNSLLRVTIKAELIGAAIAIILSTLLTLLLPVSHLTPEIFARTQPTLVDLIIALASGAAGTYAICYRSGETLPGVAIATALMPPLCVVGISLAKQEFQMAGGALLLFIANMIAINVIAILIFKIAGFTTPSISNYLNLHVNKDYTYFSRLVENKIIYPITLLFLVSIPLIYLLNGSIDADRKEKIIRGTIEEGLAVLAPDAGIISLEYTEGDDSFQINTELNSAQIILPEDIRKIENSLEYKLTAPVQLIADVSIIQKVNNEASTDGLKALLPSVPEQEVVQSVETETLTPEEIIEQVVTEKLSLFNGILDDFSFEYHRGTGTYNVSLSISTPEPLEKQFTQTIENILEDKLKRKVVATILTEENVTINGENRNIDSNQDLEVKEKRVPGPNELNSNEIVPK